MACQRFIELQKYDFSSKSQPLQSVVQLPKGCLQYCKSTIFQANHNHLPIPKFSSEVVCNTAKVRFFKQITTILDKERNTCKLFAILQKYDFSSKSQLKCHLVLMVLRCLQYCKSAIFQANHKWLSLPTYGEWWRAWPSPLAVGRGRCVGYLFGAYYLFLLKCLVSWFYFVSLH